MNSKEIMKSETFAQEMLSLQFQEVICDAMNRENVSRADLARKLGVSRAAITEYFKSGRGLSTRVIASALHAMGYEAVIGLRKKSK